MEENLRQLLLKDLCARLPYGVICNTPKGDGCLCSINQTIFGTEYGINVKATKRDYFNDREVCIKPYFRPMSSMTEEERKWLQKLPFPYDFIDALNAHHFDYRGLIEKGLAIAVTEKNNPYKE